MTLEAPTAGHKHNEKLVRDIGLCDCGRVVEYFPFEEDPNTKPIVLREGHVPGLEYIRQGNEICVYYEGKPWAKMSMETDVLAHVTMRVIQSLGQCYLREGSLTVPRSCREQVQLLLEKGASDDEILAKFPKDKRDTVRRYVRDLRKELHERISSSNHSHRKMR